MTLSTVTVEHVGATTPYFYIGDSHAGAIGSHLFRADSSTFIVTALFSIWRFVAQDIVDTDDMIGDSLMQALRRGGAFHSSREFKAIPGLRPVQTYYGKQRQTEYLEVTESSGDYPYVLSVGEINTRYLLQRLAADEMDVEVPFQITGLDELPAYNAQLTIASNRMLPLLLEEFHPLIKGLRILKNAGMRTLFLHSLPPPTIDDQDALRVYKHPSPARLRYKLTMFVNFLYDAICKEIGIGFINTWPMVTRNDLLDSRFYLDGLHLNAEHSKLSVSEVHRQFTVARAR